MALRIVAVVLVSVGAVLFTCGCPPETFPNVVPATLTEINAVVNSTTLTAQQKRDQLTELGLVPETVNALLKNERLGNQYGGDLRSAYTTIIIPDFTLLSPDQVQVYDDAAGSLDPNLAFSITDAQAQAIVDLFAAYDIRTPDELTAFLDDPESVVPTTIPDNVLAPLFVDFDPALLLPILKP